MILNDIIKYFKNYQRNNYNNNFRVYILLNMEI